MLDYIKYTIKKSTTDELLKHYNPNVINKYCQGCNKFSKIWSCPPLPFNDYEFLSRFKYCYLISGKVIINKIPEDKLASIVNDALKKYSDISITKDENTNIFNGIYYKFREYNDIKILNLEKFFPNSTALVSGRCLICNSCTRTQSRPCIYPEKLRYSLEALGLDVTSIIENLLGESLQWSSTSKPEYVTCISALLSNEDLTEESIYMKIKNL